MFIILKRRDKSAQTYKNIEIILVNDRATDDSLLNCIQKRRLV